MFNFQPIDLIGAAVALTSLTGTMAVARIQARTNRENSRDSRVKDLEAALEKMYVSAGETRDKHWATLDRVLGEEEELRDLHATRLHTERDRVDRLRVQVMSLRAELIKRGIDPSDLKHCGLPSHPHRREGDDPATCPGSDDEALPV